MQCHPIGRSHAFYRSQLQDFRADYICLTFLISGHAVMAFMGTENIHNNTNTPPARIIFLRKGGRETKVQFGVA